MGYLRKAWVTNVGTYYNWGTRECMSCLIKPGLVTIGAWKEGECCVREDILSLQHERGGVGINNTWVYYHWIKKIGKNNQQQEILFILKWNSSRLFIFTAKTYRMWFSATAFFFRSVCVWFGRLFGMCFYFVFFFLPPCVRRSCYKVLVTMTVWG